MTTASRPTGPVAPRRARQTLIGLLQLRDAGLSALAALGRLAAPAVRAVARVVGPVLRAISVIGWSLLAAAAGLFAAELVFGWSEFGYLALGLAGALAVSALFAIGRSTYAVEIELNPRRVVAGDRAMGRMLVTNSGRRGLLATRMELPVGDGLAEFAIPRLAAAESSEELFTVPTARRALIMAGPVISVRGDQLGLIRRALVWSDRIELFVHPRTVRLTASARGLVKDLEGQTTTVITDSDLAFHALRPYEAGDDIRNVHWRTSARTGQLMVRQYQETRRSQLLVLQSAEQSHYASEDEFELAVSAMASIACQVIGEASGIDIAWDEGPLRTRSRVALLDDSCRLAPLRSRYSSLRDLARRAGATLATPSVVVAVVGSLAPVAQLRSLAALYNGDTEVIVLRADPGADPRVAKVGGFTLVTVPGLASLPVLLERASR